MSDNDAPPAVPEHVDPQAIPSPTSGGSSPKGSPKRRNKKGKDAVNSPEQSSASPQPASPTAAPETEEQVPAAASVPLDDAVTEESSPGRPPLTVSEGLPSRASSASTPTYAMPTVVSRKDEAIPDADLDADMPRTGVRGAALPRPDSTDIIAPPARNVSAHVPSSISIPDNRRTMSVSSSTSSTNIGSFVVPRRLTRRESRTDEQPPPSPFVVHSRRPFLTFSVNTPTLVDADNLSGIAYWRYTVDVSVGNNAVGIWKDYAGRSVSTTRRYRDFDWLRENLRSRHLGSVVPPIPPKTIRGTVEKVVATNTKLLDLRMRGLFQFLHFCSDHSEVLQDDVFCLFCMESNIEAVRNSAFHMFTETKLALGAIGGLTGTTVEHRRSKMSSLKSKIANKFFAKASQKPPHWPVDAGLAWRNLSTMHVLIKKLEAQAMTVTQSVESYLHVHSAESEDLSKVREAIISFAAAERDSFGDEGANSKYLTFSRCLGDMGSYLAELSAAEGDKTLNRARTVEWWLAAVHQSLSDMLEFIQYYTTVAQLQGAKRDDQLTESLQNELPLLIEKLNTDFHQLRLHWSTEWKSICEAIKVSDISRASWILEQRELLLEPFQNLEEYICSPRQRDRFAQKPRA